MPIEREAEDRPGRITFLGVDHDLLDLEDMLVWLAGQRGRAGFRYVVTPNVDHVVKLFPSEPGATTLPFRNAYARASLRLCDSRVVQRLAALRGLSLPLCPGSSMTAAMMDRLLTKGDRVAIVGSAPHAVAKLRALYPAPQFLHHVPPMGVLGNEAGIAAIHAFLQEADADFILFCFGSPQSEIIAARMAEIGGVRGTVLCVGASINFITGEVKRAPAWMQRAGLEWLHRLLSEPRRMWRRYLVDDPRVFWLALTDKSSHGRA